MYDAAISCVICLHRRAWETSEDEEQEHKEEFEQDEEVEASSPLYSPNTFSFNNNPENVRADGLLNPYMQRSSHSSWIYVQ